MIYKQKQSEIVPLDQRPKNDLRDYYYEDNHLRLKDGQWEIYYDNGNLLGKGFYKEGRRVGFWQLFHNNGDIWQRGYYFDNGQRAKKNGQKYGWQYYDEHGELEDFSER